MKLISESPITTLQIIKPDVVKKFYEIRSGEDLYGSLDLINHSGTLARIESCQGSFTVKRLGFFKPYITLRRDKQETNLAVSFLNITETKIILDGNSFYFKIINLWKNQWGWTNEKKQIIVRYKPTVAGTIKGDIEVAKDFIYLPQLEIITMLGIYFLVQVEDEIINNIDK